MNFFQVNVLFAQTLPVWNERIEHSRSCSQAQTEVDSHTCGAGFILTLRIPSNKISRLQVPGPPFHLQSHLYKWARSSSPQAPAPGSISRPGSSSLLFFGISDSILEFRTSSSGIISLPLISLSLTPSPSLAPSPSPAHTSPFIPLPPFLSLSPLISLLLLLQLPESLSLSCSLLPLFLSICLSFSLSGLASRL